LGELETCWILHHTWYDEKLLFIGHWTTCGYDLHTT
jgi:hypothetical protein